MMQLRFISLLCLCIYILSACSTTPRALPLPTRTITETKIVQSYPELPELKPVPALNLTSFTWDYPRNMQEWVPKSTSKCLSVPDAQRDNSFWERCGEHPPLANSNIFMGLDDGEFKKFQLNWAKLRARLQQYKARIDEVNRQRAEWRSNAEAERVKLQDLQKKQKKGE
ncbi:MAG: hypothetical protein R8K21_01135 [Mariprofundales bacterium]